MAGNFYNFGVLEKQYTKRKEYLPKKPVLISKVTWMNFGKAEAEKHPKEVWLQYTYNDSEELV